MMGDLTQEKTIATLKNRLDQVCGENDSDALLFVQSPGRSEIAGNHTDHEGGHVIAAAVNRYISAVFRHNNSDSVRIFSEGYAPICLDLSSLEPIEQEKNTTAALVRGLCAGFQSRNFVSTKHFGFDCVLSSEVPAGSGLSSSAAFELAIAQGLNKLWAHDSLTALELAQMGQTAEREYFGKPCGLMDQAAVAFGGISHFDFFAQPRIETLEFDFNEYGYELVIVSVGSDHSANTSDYAAVPAEMQAVAQAFGKERLSQLRVDQLIGALSQLRLNLGDRAILRAFHYFNEERLVAARAVALRSGKIDTFLELTRRSGASSAMYLQNVSCGIREQPAMLALALSDELLAGKGASRIHGGGFGGTIQAFVPSSLADTYCQGMDAVFGNGAAMCCAIDHKGACARWI